MGWRSGWWWGRRGGLALDGSSGRSGEVQAGSDGVDDGLEHGGGEDAGVRVVAGDVVAVGEGEVTGEGVFGGVSKGGAAGNLVAGAQDGVVGEDAEAEDDAEVGHCLDFAGEEGVAGSGFGGLGEIFGGDAADGVDDAALGECQGVVGAGFVGADGEALGEEGLVEEESGVVTGEWAAGSVGAFDAGGHADDEEGGVDGAEAWDGGVEPGGVGGGVGVAVGDEAGAEGAVWRGGGAHPGLRPERKSGVRFLRVAGHGRNGRCAAML